MTNHRFVFALGICTSLAGCNMMQSTATSSNLPLEAHNARCTTIDALIPTREARRDFCQANPGSCAPGEVNALIQEIAQLRAEFATLSCQIAPETGPATMN